MTKRTKLIIIGTVLVIVTVVALLIQGYVRQYLAPIVLYLVWGIGLLLNSIPQWIYWAIFLFIAFSLTWNSLFERKTKIIERIEAEEKFEGRVETLSKWVQQSKQGDFFKTRLIRHLASLTVEAVGAREEVKPHEAEAMLTSGKYKLDSRIYNYLARGFSGRGSSSDVSENEFNKRLATFLQNSLFNSSQNKPYDPELEEVVKFLEEELEV